MKPKVYLITMRIGKDVLLQHYIVAGQVYMAQGFTFYADNLGVYTAEGIVISGRKRLTIKATKYRKPREDLRP